MMSAYQTLRDRLFCSMFGPHGAYPVWPKSPVLINCRLSAGVQILPLSQSAWIGILTTPPRFTKKPISTIWRFIKTQHIASAPRLVCKLSPSVFSTARTDAKLLALQETLTGNPQKPPYSWTPYCQIINPVYSHKIKTVLI